MVTWYKFGVSVNPISPLTGALRVRVQNFVYKTSRLVRISLLISAITKISAFFLGKVNS